MAIGTQLGQLLTVVQYEAGHSARVNVGVDSRDAIKEMIRRTQETLFDEYDWPHLRVIASKTLAAGQRHYDWPSDLDRERVTRVFAYWNEDPIGLERGIDFEEYAVYDSDADERADPPQRWDVRWTGSATQLEIWPIPATGNTTIRFRGLRPLTALTEESDTADLDDRLITLFVAAELLGGQKSANGRLKLELASQRLRQVRSRALDGTESVVYGGGAMPGQRSRRGQTIIRVS